MEEKVATVMVAIVRIAAELGQFSRICQVASTCTLSNTRFLGPTRVCLPNGISSGSAVFAQLTRVTEDRQTDRQTDRRTDGQTDRPR